MALYMKTLSGDFDEIVQSIEDGVLQRSTSASLEEKQVLKGENSKCAILVFERFSYSGGNRVSMSITLYENETGNHLIAVSSGGSQAVFWKLNTWGEEAFLDTLKEFI